MDANKAYIGTELKFAIAIEAEGFSMEDDNFTVELRCGLKSITLDKGDCIEDASGNWYITFDSRELGSGIVRAIITAYVPDDDFDDGFRTEVAKIDLIHINNL